MTDKLNQLIQEYFHEGDVVVDVRPNGQILVTGKLFGLSGEHLLVRMLQTSRTYAQPITLDIFYRD